MKTILFSHGKEGSPSSKKIKLLEKVAQKYNYKTVVMDYTSTLCPETRVKILSQKLDELKNDSCILVGSSMGGYVSIVSGTNRPIKGLFLMCPALYLKEYATQQYPIFKNTSIIHGWNDTVVPHENSIKYGQKALANVLLVNDNHRLKDSYNLIEKEFNHYLNNLT